MEMAIKNEYFNLVYLSLPKREMFMGSMLAFIIGLLIIACLGILQIVRYKYFCDKNEYYKKMFKSEIMLLIVGAVIYRLIDISRLKIIVIFYSLIYMPIFVICNILMHKKDKSTTKYGSVLTVVIFSAFVFVYTIFFF